MQLARYIVGAAVVRRAALTCIIALFASVPCLVAICDLDCGVAQVTSVAKKGESGVRSNDPALLPMNHCAGCRHCQQKGKDPSRQPSSHALFHLNFYLRQSPDLPSQVNAAVRFQLPALLFSPTLDLHYLGKDSIVSNVLGDAPPSALAPLVLNLRI
jgi:hypothetical protein